MTNSEIIKQMLYIMQDSNESDVIFFEGLMQDSTERFSNVKKDLTIATHTIENVEARKKRVEKRLLELTKILYAMEANNDN